MNHPPCLCTGRGGIRCDETHCDLAGPGAPGDANQCRVCWLRLGGGRWTVDGGQKIPDSAPSTVHRSPSTTNRGAPCLFLGEVLDRLGCACPARWLRRCEIHKVCTLEQCKVCADYVNE